MWDDPVWSRIYPSKTGRCWKKPHLGQYGRWDLDTFRTYRVVKSRSTQPYHISYATLGHAMVICRLRTNSNTRTMADKFPWISLIARLWQQILAHLTHITDSRTTWAWESWQRMKISVVNCLGNSDNQSLSSVWAYEPDEWLVRIYQHRKYKRRSGNIWHHQLWQWFERHSVVCASTCKHWFLKDTIVERVGRQSK